MNLNTISNILKIPSQFLEWPLILTNLILPLIFFWYAIKCLLDKLKIFGYSNINWGIAFIIALSSLFFISSLSMILTPISIFMIGLFKLRGKTRILFIVGGIALYWFVLPLLIGWLPNF